MANQDGVVLTRTRTVAKRGDNIFYDSPQGRAAAKGKSTVSFERSSVNDQDFIMIASSPMLDNGKNIGSVFGGYSLNKNSADQIKGENAELGAELAYYMKSVGITGSTFNDTETAQKISNLFSAGSDWVLKGRGGDIISIGNKSYYVENLVLPGLESSLGGALVFLPISVMPIAIPLSAVWFLTILGTALLLAYCHKRFCGRHPRLLIWLISSAIIIFSTFGIWTYFAKYKNAININQPAARIYNSVLKFEPDSGLFDTSYKQSVAIKVLSGGENINAVNIMVDFDPTAMEVEDINTVNSFCQKDLFVEKLIDNKQGKISIVCGVPNPGFTSQEGIVAELIIKPLREGRFSLNFSPYSQVMANDGLGTNVLRQVNGASYQIEDYKKDSDNDLTVVSPSHPNSEKWYQEKNIEFYWGSVVSVNQKLTYIFSHNPNAVPDKNFDGVLTGQKSLNLRAKNDGIYYFNLLAWQGNKPLLPAASVKVKIDSSPPDQPVIKLSSTELSKGDILRMEFASNDSLSGLQRNFYVMIDDNYFLPSGSSLFMPFVEAGKHKIIVRAFDNAGNYSDSVQEVEVK